MVELSKLKKGQTYKIWYKIMGHTFVYEFPFHSKTSCGHYLFELEDESDGLHADPADIIKISKVWTRKRK